MLIRDFLPTPPPFLLSLSVIISADSGTDGSSDASDENNNQQVHYLNINTYTFSLIM